MNERDDGTRTHALGDPRVEMLRVRAATIEVTSGADAGKHARIERPTFVVGTGDSADLRITDTTVSREHLRLSLATNGVGLRDEGSKNGTWVGGVRVRDALATADTTIAIGKTQLLLRIDAAPIELALSASARFGDAIGVSPAMRHLFAILERAARSDVTVLLEGESGVGKEVLARTLHAASSRADGPFVAVDCGAIPATLIESELFGHERGAFTGAEKAREGVFEQADGGTLFLDEIGELPLELQPKLLRVLETREVRPLGGKGSKSVDVRVLAATNRRLAEAASEGGFRKDLFYRLAVARVTIAPLRDRPDDIGPLARAFLRSATRDDAAELPPDLLAMLTSYAWPGNVRELRNVIERYAVLGLRDARGLFDAQPATSGAFEPDLSHLSFHEARRQTLDRFERAYLPKVLERAGGVVSRAAEMAEVARPSFYRMMERLRVRGGDDEEK
jgi:transcriptional regulator with PAS, ATPase and Fis domain